MEKPYTGIETIASKGYTRREFIKIMGKTAALTGLVGLVAACASMRQKPDFYPQKGMPNTMTYIDSKTKEEKVVYDLRGKWETLYYGNKEIVEITQEGNYFEGFKTIGSRSVPAGAKTIRGTIEGNVVHCETYGATKGWDSSTRKISEDGNSFQCFGDELRTFKRLTR